MRDETTQENVTGLDLDFKLHRRVTSMVEALLGDLQEKWPEKIEDYLVLKGHPKENVDAMNADEKLEKVIEILKNRPTHTAVMITALDMIFELRYGWEPGTAAKMTVPKVFIALEHALDYDDPKKPSIWEITK